MNVLIVQPSVGQASETFLTAQAERMSASTVVVHNLFRPQIGSQPVLSEALLARGLRKASRIMRQLPWEWELTTAFIRAIRQTRADIVLAQYGPTGVAVMEACRLAGTPLVVHFHGYDASKQHVLAKYAESYRAMFEQAAAIIAVSRAMERRLLSLGCPPENLRYNAYGIDCDLFGGSNPASAPPAFLAVGRFVEKKAPHLTLLAFAEVFRRCPQARLRMIGTGPLLGVCRDLAAALGISDAVSFLGVQPPDIVAQEMRSARAFVQHSVEASDGDCEGTPVAVLEAGASGLPVVSTRHAGIPDVVIDEKTGLLVDERDIVGMTTAMLRLAENPRFAAAMGAAAQEQIFRKHTLTASLSRLARILQCGLGQCRI